MFSSSVVNARFASVYADLTESASPTEALPAEASPAKVELVSADASPAEVVAAADLATNLDERVRARACGVPDEAATADPAPAEAVATAELVSTPLQPEEKLPILLKMRLLQQLQEQLLLLRLCRRRRERRGWLQGEWHPQWPSRGASSLRLLPPSEPPL
jgi:hypothetical protein